MIFGNKYKNIGRRKTAVSKINICPGTGKIFINSKTLLEYFHYNPRCEFIILQFNPLLILNLENNYDVFVSSKGGGVSAQSDSIKLALSRLLFNSISEEDRKKLKLEGFLTQNSKKKERKKYGLKKARKASQFSKR
uniref:Small ribosomal subunit protein uS9c n=1 Tax=Phacus orbicularis TaxID=158829 RepID=A0A172F1M7_9EUGL|nr:ribosomal protein S9 [Phacus orbicularis]